MILRWKIELLIAFSLNSHFLKLILNQKAIMKMWKTVFQGSFALTNRFLFTFLFPLFHSKEMSFYSKTYGIYLKEIKYKNSERSELPDQSEIQNNAIAFNQIVNLMRKIWCGTIKIHDIEVNVSETTLSTIS